MFDAEVIHLARKRGYSIAVVPVQWTDQRGSRMRVRPRLAARVAWDLVRIPLIHRGVQHARRRRTGTGRGPTLGPDTAQPTRTQPDADAVRGHTLQVSA